MEEETDLGGSEKKPGGKSRLGIASFVCAIIAIGFNAWFIASLFAPENQQALAFAWPPGWVILFCYPLPVNTIGLVLGLRARKRGDNSYATLGIIGNSIAFLPAILGILLLISV